MTSERELELAFEYRDTLSSLRLSASDVERVERVGKRRRIVIVYRDDEGRAIEHVITPRGIVSSTRVIDI
jgi:hypothetical protein